MTQKQPLNIMPMKIYIAMLYKLINFKGQLWDSLGIFGEIYWDIPRQIFTLSLNNQTVCIVKRIAANLATADAPASPPLALMAACLSF